MVGDQIILSFNFDDICNLAALSEAPATVSLTGIARFLMTVKDFM